VLCVAHGTWSALLLGVLYVFKALSLLYAAVSERLVRGMLYANNVRWLANFPQVHAYICAGEPLNRGSYRSLGLAHLYPNPFGDTAAVVLPVSYLFS
jgi:hypothetical protein